MGLPTRKLFSTLLVLVAGLSGAMPAASGSPPRWPLDLPTRYLTSGFMEYRPGRYHAGLDLKTRGRTGFAVHAAEDGSIVRVRATARAYGRAVYLQTPGGKTYVYAHLSRFNDSLRAEIAKARRKSGKYRTELYFKPGRLTVRRGEVLGLTGQSGTAGPHLHFEVRDGAQHPLNPLGQGFAVPDTFPPVIYAVHAVPMVPEAEAGGCRAVMACGHSGTGALPDTLAPLVISGPVAFSARVVDYSDIRGYRLEPERITVTLDGKEVYRAVNTYFAFDQGSRQRLEWFGGFSRPERWLFRRRAVDVPGREGDRWPLGTGGQGLPAGPHELVIEAVDHAGGRDVVVLPLLVGSGVQAGGWRPDSLRTPPGIDPAWVRGCRLNPFFGPGCPPDDWTETVLDPREGDPVLQPVVLLSRPVDLPDSLLARARAQCLEPIAMAGAFLATDWPIESSVPVVFPAGGEDGLLPALERVPARVYRWDGENWSGAYPLVVEGGRQGFKLGRPGLYAVFLDRKPPVLSVPGAEAGVLTLGTGPRYRIPGVTPPRWEVFPVAVVEDGAGVDPSSVTATLDGKVLIPEPDLPRSRLLVELPTDVPPGTHFLTLAVADKCGNRAELTVTLKCLDAESGGEK